MKNGIALRALIGLLGLAAVNGAVSATDFSIDPASPAIDGVVTPDDVLTPGPAVFLPGTDLALQDSFATGQFDNLNALSYGQKLLTALPGQSSIVRFSVDRVSRGIVGSDVWQDAQPGVEEAAGNVYEALPAAGTHTRFLQQTQLGLTPGFFGDDVDALELFSWPDPHVYFCIDALSASTATGARACDILLDVADGPAFALGQAHLGLQAGDDIDALAVDDTFNPGFLDPGIDSALFSLSAFSPSTFTGSGRAYVPGAAGRLSPADILFTDFTGGFSLYASAAALGLAPDDELNALVPEPTGMLCLAAGLCAMLIHPRRRTTIHATMPRPARVEPYPSRSPRSSRARANGRRAEAGS